tara:strand:+ start:1563 stop:1712 length:150 start_codon:yes stop_codon:yes gene_type:complete
VGISISAKGIINLKLSSNVSELMIQYKLEIKYPKPKIHPTKKKFDLPEV